MLVRIVNERTNIDKFIDCSFAQIVPDKARKEVFLSVRVDKEDTTYNLSYADKIYFMNNNGKTIHSDCRCLDSEVMHKPSKEAEAF